MHTITLNGEQREIESATLEALLAELELTEKRVAIEHNKIVVPRSQYDNTRISDGDTVEVVHFVGGG